MPELKRRPDLTSMELQKFVGEDYLRIKAELEKAGLKVFCGEHHEKREITSSLDRHVDIRYDKGNREIIRIWRTGQVKMAKKKPKTSCCEAMKGQIERECPVHPNKIECPDFVVIKTKSGFGIPIRDGGRSFLAINFCPWCGTRIT